MSAGYVLAKCLEYDAFMNDVTADRTSIRMFPMPAATRSSMVDDRRISLVASSRARRQWNKMSDAPSRIIELSSLTILRHALEGGMRELAQDVERVVVDRIGTAADYLSLLACLPLSFLGDVVLITDDGSGYISAVGRGGDRVLYAAPPAEMTFYLEAHRLVDGSAATAVSHFPLLALAR